MTLAQEMLEFRVTKYDPKNRNEAGHYLLDEWTCFSEVGGSVSLEEYEKVEGAYLASAIDFARMWSTEGFTISGLEDHHENTQLVEGQQMTADDVPSVLRSILRNEFWCRLENTDGFIHVGWDYYMYVGVPKVDRSIVTAAQARGLFVEEFISPYHPEKC